MKRRNSQQGEQGVALVITLVLLAVITFMAVTFLVVSRRERQRAGAQTIQTEAYNMANMAQARAQAQMVASMLARGNSHDFGLFVSTNYITRGFDSSLGFNVPTNVSYNYAASSGGGPLTQKDYLKLMSNLRYLPRVPVFIATNKALPPEFRYYLDLNRNGVYDTNGFGTNFNAAGPIFYTDPTGVLRPLTTYFVGDPEWVGVLDKPDQNHSSSNLFVGRYCFIAIPIGNGLDLNYIYNQAKVNARSSPPAQLSRIEGYRRNQGYGAWEMNLAAFLHYLNPDFNVWGGYHYDPDLNFSSTANSQWDALGILRYRCNNQFANQSVQTAFGGGAAGNIASKAFQNDFIDGYVLGPLYITNVPPPVKDPDVGLTARPWPGADNLVHFFSTQDFFNTNSVNANFTSFANHLIYAGLQTNVSTNRYTFYRMLAQAGMESAPEAPGKINLNYDNIHSTATTFSNWTAVGFFTNAADRMLKTLIAGDPSHVRYSANPALGVNYIPLFDGTNFFYDPAVHRILQLAANIYEATKTTNRYLPNSTNPYPSVYRPTFALTNLAGRKILYINNYVEDGTNSNPFILPAYSLPEDSNAVMNALSSNPSSGTNMNLYGVPWVIGAQKGLPNFNEVTMATFSQITRKLQLDKRGSVSTPRANWRTNEQFVIGISNLVGVEAWNSYVATYPRDVDIAAVCDLRMQLAITNADGSTFATNFPSAPLPTPYFFGTNFYTVVANGSTPWYGFRNTGTPSYDASSFQIPVQTNVIFVPDSAYRPKATPALVPGTNVAFIQNGDISTPHFVLGVTNRLRFMIRDHATGRIIDYVQLNGMNTPRDLSTEMQDSDTFGIWDTNLYAAGARLTKGVNRQLRIALGDPDPGDAWKNAQLSPLSGQSKIDAINGFNNFFNGTDTTNTQMQVPFTPTAKISQVSSWQANDPLVHYTLADLTSYPKTNTTVLWVPPNNNPNTNGLGTLQRINDRYKPWGGKPNNTDASTDYVLAYKDPGMWNSDAWDFPTNKFPSIGWLGRVHRGTPWQTIYLKSTATDLKTWQTWSGNPDTLSAYYTQPTNDWQLMDIFTVAPNANASRGRLSINQTNMAAWAAVLQGVVAISNNAVLPIKGGAPALSIPIVIDPVTNDWAFSNIVAGINLRRSSFVSNNVPAYLGQVFTNLGDILSVPELTVNSPFINTNASPYGLTDAMYERLPQEILSLLKVGEPRYLIFAYGQSLRPAPNSIVQAAGSSFGMCTNYQITGEVATRAVVSITEATRPRPGLNSAPGAVKPQPQIVVESFNVLAPEQ